MNLLDIVPNEIKLDIIEYGGKLEVDNIIERIMLRNEHWSLPLFLRYIKLLELSKKYELYDHIIQGGDATYIAFNTNEEKYQYQFVKQIIESRILNMQYPIQRTINLGYQPKNNAYDLLFKGFGCTDTLKLLHNGEYNDILQSELRNAIEDNKFRKTIPSVVYELFEYLNDMKVCIYNFSTELDKETKYLGFDDILYKGDKNRLKIIFGSITDKKKFMRLIKDNEKLISFDGNYSGIHSVLINDLHTQVTTMEKDMGGSLSLGVYVIPDGVSIDNNIKCNYYFKSIHILNGCDNIFEIIQRYKYSLCPVHY